MFNNRRLNIVLSIVIAICLWAYVVGFVDPETTRSVSDIPVEFQNEDDLADEGLALEDPGETRVKITVSGHRSAIHKLEETQVRARVDLADCGKGENRVAINIDLPKGLNVEESDPEVVTLAVSNRLMKQQDVSAVFSDLADGTEVGSVAISPSVINASGSEGQMKKVDHVQVEVSTDGAKSGTIEEEVRPVAVDKKGNPVDHIILMDKKVTVRGTVYRTKTVDLEVETTGEVDSSVVLEEVQLPEKITVRGPDDALKKLDSMQAENISLDGIKKTTEIPLSLYLDYYGVELAEGSKDPTATIVVMKKDT